MEYKKEILVDLYNLDLCLNYERKEITWNANEDIILTLKPNCEVLETRFIFNPSFSNFPFGKRITSFQKMWKPDENNFLLFTSLLNHLKQNTLSCDQLCIQLNLSAVCSELIEILATSGRPPELIRPDLP